MRWQHPSCGLLHPAAFLDHLQRAGLQRQLADTVLELSLVATATWWHQGIEAPVSINLSAANTTDLELPAKLLAATRRHRLPYAIIRHTIALAHDLGLHVVAEGIETAEAATALRELGCGAGQGYWFAVPMPAEEFVVWLTTHEPPAATAAPVPVLTRSPTTDSDARGEGTAHASGGGNRGARGWRI